MRRGVLRPHVDDHQLVIGRLVVDHVVVLDDPAVLGIESVLRFVIGDLLCALVGGLELRLLGPRDPKVDDLGLVHRLLVRHLNRPCGKP